jgi:hypothetical protein
MIISTIRYFTYVPKVPTTSTTEVFDLDVTNETEAVK